MFQVTVSNFNMEEVWDQLSDRLKALLAATPTPAASKATPAASKTTPTPSKARPAPQVAAQIVSGTVRHLKNLWEQFRPNGRPPLKRHALAHIRFLGGSVRTRNYIKSPSLLKMS